MLIAGRLKTVAVAATFAALALCGDAAAAPGDLDPTFGSAGKVLLNSPESFDSAADDLLAQPNGTLVAVGLRYSRDARFHPAAFGFLPNGAPDLAFGGNGTGFIDTGEGYRRQAKAVLDQEGKILIATLRLEDGYPAVYTIELVRLLPGGVPDPSFGLNGVVDTGVSVRGEVGANDLALAPDGGIVVLSPGPDDSSFQITRMLPDGRLDPGFSDDGIVTVATGDTTAFPYAYPNAVDVLPTGGVVAAGSGTDSTGNTSAILLELDAAGQLNPDFGVGGITSTRFKGVGARIGDIAIQPDDRIVAVGSRYREDASEAIVARFLANGKLDRSFSFDGQAEVATRRRGASLGSLVLQPDGKIVAAGSTGGDFLVARLRPNGARDLGFSGDGFATTGLGGSSDEATSVALQPGGKIVVAGLRRTFAFRGRDESLALTRYLVGKGRHDMDADGRRDHRDLCPNLPARGHHGCPFYERTLTFFASFGGFGGEIDSENFHCRTSEPVDIVKQLPGRDRVIETVHTYDQLGNERYFLPFDDPQGRFYGRLPERVARQTGLCQGVRSAVVTVERLNSQSAAR